MGQTNKMWLLVAMAILIASHSLAEAAAATRKSTLFPCSRKIVRSRVDDGEVLLSGKYPQRDLAAVMVRDKRSSYKRVNGYIISVRVHTVFLDSMHGSLFCLAWSLVRKFAYPSREKVGWYGQLITTCYSGGD
ncbi:unnamed protein product [Victoria cruziana]